MRVTVSTGLFAMSLACALGSGCLQSAPLATSEGALVQNETGQEQAQSKKETPADRKLTLSVSGMT